MVTTPDRTLHDALGRPRHEPGDPAFLYLDLPRLTNEQQEPLRLLASWLLPEHEGAVFYAGTGGAVMTPVPAAATGFRLRRWPSEGLAPEYLDWLFER